MRTHIFLLVFVLTKFMGVLSTQRHVQCLKNRKRRLGNIAEVCSQQPGTLQEVLISTMSSGQLNQVYHMFAESSCLKRQSLEFNPLMRICSRL